MTIEELLNRLSEYQAQKDLLDLDKQALIDAVYTPEIKAKIEEINSEFEGKAEAVSENIATLQDQVKAEVIQHGATVKGKNLMAVWVKGRVSWDSKKLDGLMLAFPALAGARKEGEPSCTIRRI